MMKNSLKLKILTTDVTMAPDTIAYSSFNNSNVNSSQPSYRWKKHLLSPKLFTPHIIVMPTISAD